ncbi:hypothetical protein [Lentilactobacillus parabuchneri]|uniref:hypothetical protein n=1 Tax=Lentilactobacillus parabuchneri TaxID=152331 RepID=UPI0015C41B36|nr:hypothetical protein [Lentilactobacillus parabuchneri]MCW4399229.1 hypothetical protein [Lentilactobacillus parabuchneri]
MRRATGDAVSKPALIEVPGLGALIKAGLEVRQASVASSTGLGVALRLRPSKHVFSK